VTRLRENLVAELQANCVVMGAYYCGECLPCKAADEIERLRTLTDGLYKIIQQLDNPDATVLGYKTIKDYEATRVDI